MNDSISRAAKTLNRLAHKARMAKTTPEQRTAAAKKAAKARWERHKASPAIVPAPTPSMPEAVEQPE